MPTRLSGVRSAVEPSPAAVTPVIRTLTRGPFDRLAIGPFDDVLTNVFQSRKTLADRLNAEFSDDDDDRDFRG